jgi:hypothetical protein
MLKYIYATKEEIPEALTPYYQESGGKWVLECEGAVPKARLDEFRQNNVELQKRLDAFKDLDAEECRKLVALKADLEASKAKTPEQIEAEVSKRTAKMSETHQAELDAIKKREQALSGELERLTIDNGAAAAAAELGVRKTALPDLIARVRGVFKLEDGKPVAYVNGEKAFSKTGEPLGLREYVETLGKEAPHLFEESKGAGAGGSGAPGSGGGTGGANPWKKDSINLTEQARILKQDPTTARRLAAQAGVTLR